MEDLRKSRLITVTDELRTKSGDSVPIETVTCNRHASRRRKLCRRRVPGYHSETSFDRRSGPHYFHKDNRKNNKIIKKRFKHFQDRTAHKRHRKRKRNRRFSSDDFYVDPVVPSGKCKGHFPRFKENSLFSSSGQADKRRKCSLDMAH